MKTGTYAATCRREKGVGEYATSWTVSLFRRLGYCRAILQSDGESSNAAPKTASLLAAPRVELGLRKSPVGQHAATGVAESALREVKRQTRTLKFALGALVRKIVESHPILRCLPPVASDAISFFRFGRDSLEAAMRRCGREWNKLVAEFGEPAHCRPAVSKTIACGMQPWLYFGRYLGHHASTSIILIMTTEGVVEAAVLGRNEKSRWNVEIWNALRGLPCDATETETEATQTVQVELPQIIHLLLTPRRHCTLDEIWCDGRLLCVF